MKKNISCLLAIVILSANGFLLALTANSASGADLAQRFSVPKGFRIECVADHELTGSLWAMTFDHQGRIVVSRQKSPIVTLIDQDNDGRCDLAKPFNDRLTHSEGLTFVDGSLYTVGQGPDWVGLYRLTDDNGDDQADRIELVGPFGSKGMGEHAPHGIVYGPDGCLYVVVGNHAQLPDSVDPDSPLNRFYEGQLLPRYADANGHAAGVLAPGGTVARIELATNRWSRVAGGFRNAYDLAFNAAGELFTYDSDMEWDERMPWYRPTRINHVVPAGDYGWRNGSGKWPTYFLDSLPTTLDLGRGSPCGVVFYQHEHFPSKYHGALFLCDWSRGRIVAVFMEPDGASYKCKAETFATGRPLNVNDIAVGPDGAIYFSVGGRDTEGGVYRIVYENNQSAQRPITATLEAAVRQLQPDAPWARARLRKIKNQLGDRWASGLKEIANDTERDAQLRCRALTMLQQFGPVPDETTLITLSQDVSHQVRANAVFLLGMHSSIATREALSSRLSDQHGQVRRRACEAFVRAKLQPPVEQLLPLLNDSDRWVRYAACALLRRYDPAQYRNTILQSNNPRVAIEGMLALLANDPDQAHLLALVDRQATILQTPLSDELLLDLLRLVQLTLVRDATPHAFEPVQPMLLQAFDRDDWRIKREAARLLAFLDQPQAIDKMLDQMESDIPWEQQIHYTFCLRSLTSGWTRETRQRLIDWFGRTRLWTGGASFSGYLDMLWNDALKLLPPEDRDEVLAELVASVSQNNSKQGAPAKSYDHTLLEIEEFLLRNPSGQRGDIDKGKKAFVTAGCAVCHKFGSDLPGRGIGPDLTTVAARFKRHEILDSILHPSRVISDQYKAVNVLTDAGKVVTGIQLGDDKEQLVLKRTDGTLLTIPQDAVVHTSKAMSMMPERALNVLTLDEIAHLFAYLESTDANAK